MTPRPDRLYVSSLYIVAISLHDLAEEVLHPPRPNRVRDHESDQLNWNWKPYYYIIIINKR